MLKLLNLINGEALAEMDKLITDGIIVDAIICDPPYGTTACKWDSVIPFNEYAIINGKTFHNKDEFILDCYKRKMSHDEIEILWSISKRDGMWQKLNKLVKPNGAIVLFGSEPFSSALRMSNIKNYKYDWVWEKPTATGYLNAKKQPMRAYENMMVFYRNQPTYNYQKTQGHERKVSSAESKANCKQTEVYGKHELTSYDSTERYPRNVIIFPTDKQKSKLHPTQKPVALMEYLIKTYTNEGELVLDFTMGSGTTMVACKNTNRRGRGIGIELDEKYYKIAQDRINKPKDTLF